MLVREKLIKNIPYQEWRDMTVEEASKRISSVPPRLLQQAMENQNAPQRNVSPRQRTSMERRIGENSMKMSPMQKYAMRLLIASGQVRLPDRNAWSQLTTEMAAEQLRRFGGVQAILRDTVLPQRSSSAEESRLPASKSIPFSLEKSELER